MVKLDLQRFAEGMDMGAAAGTADTGGMAEPNAQTGDGGRMISAPTDGAQPNTGGQPDAGAQQPTFQDLVQGQYRQEYEQAVGQRIRTAIQDRFKNQQDYRQQADAMRPIMASLGQKFGLNPNDVQGIAAKLNEDAYAEEANQRGVPVDVVRNEHQLKNQVQQLQAREAAARQQMVYRAHFEGLQKQAQELAQEFPGFDLMQELTNNPKFAQWTAPGSNMSLREAFFASHGEELQKNGMKYAAAQAGRSIAASVAAGASRPQENGMGTTGSANIAIDPRHMSREQRQAIRDQLSMGKYVPI